MKLNIPVLKKRFIYNIQKSFKPFDQLKKNPVYIGARTVIVILIIFFIISKSSGTPNIATYEVEIGEFIIDIQEKGELKASKSTAVGVPSRIYGITRVTKIAEDGTIVKEGDFLVQFDTSEFENRVKERQNELENAKADLTSQKASIESKRKEQENNYLIQQYDYEKSELQYQQMKYEAAARQRQMELDFKKADLNLLQAKEKLESQKIIDEANLSKAELKVKQAEMKLKEAQEMFESLTLTAPINGMVVLQKIYGPNGPEKVKVGSSPWRGMDIIHIPDLSVMQAKTAVNETDISKIEKGQNVVVTVEALEGKAYYGKITRVAPLARREKSTNVKVFDIEVTLDSTDGLLRPGMTSGCRIFTGRIPDALSVPLQSIFQKEEKTVVYVMETRGPKVREVKVGEKSSDMIVILEGLEGDEKICLRDPTIPLDEIGIESEASQIRAPKPKRSSSGTRDGMRVIIH